MMRLIVDDFSAACWPSGFRCLMRASVKAGRLTARAVADRFCSDSSGTQRSSGPRAKHSSRGACAGGCPHRDRTTHPLRLLARPFRNLFRRSLRKVQRTGRGGRKGPCRRRSTSLGYPPSPGTAGRRPAPQTLPEQDQASAVDIIRLNGSLQFMLNVFK
jgi:hypothetical protein